MRYLPSYPFQVEHENGGENGIEMKGNKCCHGRASNLGVAECLPQRPAFESKREECEDGRSNGDHDGPDTLDARIGQGTVEWLALFVHLLDEVGEHDDVAVEHPHGAGHPHEM